MTQIENYKNILKTIFKKPIIFKHNTVKNNCIGALNDSSNFCVFKTNFIDRLIRINEYFSKSPQTLSKIINTAKEIGQREGYKWSGPYSELVALDYWIQFGNIIKIKYIEKGNVEKFEDSIAKKVGHKEVDIDMSLDFDTIKIYTDVKSLIPTYKELVDNILDQVKLKTRDKDYLIGIDDIFDVDYLRIKKDFANELRQQSGNLINGLVECINSKKRIYKYKLQSGANVLFRIEYSKVGQSTILNTRLDIWTHIS